MLKIGGILQARMVQKDMKQKELANLLNVDQRTISSYCKNISFPNLETLSAICEILELDLNELLQIHAKGNEELLIHDDIELSLLQHLDVYKRQVLIHHKIHRFAASYTLIHLNQRYHKRFLHQISFQMPH